MPVHPQRTAPAAPRRSVRRRRTLAAFTVAATVAGGIVLAGTGGQAAFAAEGPLKDVAAAKGVCFGTAGEAAYNDEDSRFGDVLGREFCAITAENSMKWDAVRWNSDRSYDLAAADRVVALAKSKGVKVRGHALNWHSQNPSWVQDAQWSRDEAIGVLTDHIDTMVRHFGNDVYTWDVVNEAIDFFGNRRGNNPWQRMIGDDHYAISFRAARAANANARLCYNDDWNDWRYDSKALKGGEGDTGAQGFTVDDTMIALKQQGVPVDCVGIQLHTQIDDPHDTDQEVADTMTMLGRRMDRLAAAGIEVDLTELDVRGRTPLSDADRQRQDFIYRELIETCLAHSNCKNISVWGTSDKKSWIPAFNPGYGDALLFDGDYQPKGTYYAVRDALGGSGGTPAPTTSPTGSPGGGGDQTRSGTTGLKLAAAGGYMSAWQYADGLGTNVRYRAAVHVRGSGQVQLRVHAGDWGGDLATADCVAVADQWKQCSAEFTNGGDARVTFRLTDSTAGGTVYLDDASLVPVSGGNDMIRSSGFESAGDWNVQSPFSLIR